MRGAAARRACPESFLAGTLAAALTLCHTVFAMVDRKIEEPEKLRKIYRKEAADAAIARYKRAVRGAEEVRNGRV